MIYYDMGSGAEAMTTNIGDIPYPEIITPSHQGHTTNVALIPEEEGSTYNVDALITNVKGQWVGVRTADCVPILLHDPVHRAVGAVHSGWKGTVNNIISKALMRMTATYGSCCKDVIAVIGPCIHLEAFEVGDEVYEAFREAGYRQWCKRMRNPYDNQSPQKWHIDLPGICHSQLSACGVKEVEQREECTYRDYERFYSYRRCGLSDRKYRAVSAIRLI